MDHACLAAVIDDSEANMIGYVVKSSRLNADSVMIKGPRFGFNVLDDVRKVGGGVVIKLFTLHLNLHGIRVGVVIFFRGSVCHLHCHGETRNRWENSHGVQILGAAWLMRWDVVAT